MAQKKDQINEFLKEGFNLKDVQKHYKEFTSQSKIELFAEEDYVIKELMLGKKKNYIVTTLNKKYPDTTFSSKDVDLFIERHRGLVKYFEEKNHKLARRHLQARAEVEEELSGVAMFTRELIKKYDNQNDHGATINAIKALNQTIMNLSKISGFLEAPERKEAQNIINIVSKRNVKLRDKLTSANFKMIEEKPIEIKLKKDGNRKDDKGHN